MNNYRQIIRVPDKITRHFFSLKCVLAAGKSSLDDSTSYTVDAMTPRGDVALKAYPGDYLCEKHDGGWVRVSSWDTAAIEQLQTR